MFYCQSESFSQTHTHKYSESPLLTPPRVKQIPFKSGPAAATQGVRRDDCEWDTVCVHVCVFDMTEDVCMES